MTIVMKPFFFLQKKEVWFFIDRPFGIDNAYHLFLYSQKQNDNIKKIYLIQNKKDAQYKNLDNNSDIVYNFSLKHFWYFIHAKKIIISFDTKPFYFYKQGLLFKKILKPKTDIILLGHGVTKSYIEPYQKSYTDFSIFCAVSPEEKKLIKKIGYSEEIHITGFPRFDALTDNTPKKKILFMPTWDASLFGKSEEVCKNSEYFKGIQSFLAHENLHALLEKENYTLIYTPHYMMEKYLHLLDISHPQIKILSGKQCDVQQCMKDANIMITDYSSIMFDFAYMKKPALYYRFAPHHYEELFDVEKDGFGEIVTDTHTLIEKLAALIQNNSQIEEKYINNIEKFFTYIDGENCKRTYNTILEN